MFQKGCVAANLRDAPPQDRPPLPRWALPWSDNSSWPPPSPFNMRASQFRRAIAAALQMLRAGAANQTDVSTGPFLAALRSSAFTFEERVN